MAPLPDPPSLRRHITLGSLLAVGFSALWVAYLLLPDAAYALSTGRPQELGALATAPLPDRETWVSASGTPESNALSFSRFGERGSFRLTRAQERENVWLLLQVPSDLSNLSIDKYVPPAHFVGRLSPLADSKLLPQEIEDAIKQKSKSFSEAFVLIDGESPQSQKPSLFAAILLALLGAGCLSSAFFLWRDEKGPLPKS